MNRRNFIGLLSAIPVIGKLFNKREPESIKEPRHGPTTYVGEGAEFLERQNRYAYGDMRYDSDSGEMYVFGGNKDGWKKLI